MTDTIPTGWKFTIPVAPISYQDKIIVYKPKPHLEEAPKSNEYRYAIKNELAKIIAGAFSCPVKLEMDFYMATNHASYPTGTAFMASRCLVPELISDQRLIKECVSRVHYPGEAKDWFPRIELVVTPILI